MEYVDKIKVSRAEILARTQDSQHESLDELRTRDTIDFNDHPDLFELFQEYLQLGDPICAYMETQGAIGEVLPVGIYDTKRGTTATSGNKLQTIVSRRPNS